MRYPEIVLFLRLRTGMYTEYTDTEQNLIYHTGLYVRIYFQMQNYFFFMMRLSSEADTLLSHIMRKSDFYLCEKKAQVSFAVTAKLISAFVFATRIVQFLFFLNPKFQASCLLLCLYKSVCVGAGRNSRRPVFSRRGSFQIKTKR